jgi:CheY-like chemotaxis protein
MSAKGLKVFVVEDEAMIRMMVADMLDELGHTIAAEAGTLDQALELAQSAEFDLAILDVNLNGKVITPVADYPIGPSIISGAQPGGFLLYASSATSSA